MTGDVADFVARFRAVLPTRWFGDVSPKASALLSGLGTAWSAVYQLVGSVANQARLGTAYGQFLDMFSADFFGRQLPRRGGEADGAYRNRISARLLSPGATRGALLCGMRALTGSEASVFEPARPEDTGSYNAGGCGYGVAGGWGNLQLPCQAFLTVPRPSGGGIALLAGYGSGGVPVYGGVAMIESRATDDEIYALAAGLAPAGTTLWIQLIG